MNTFFYYPHSDNLYYDINNISNAKLFRTKPQSKMNLKITYPIYHINNVKPIYFYLQSQHVHLFYLYFVLFNLLSILHYLIYYSYIFIMKKGQKLLKILFVRCFSCRSIGVYSGLFV